MITETIDVRRKNLVQQRLARHRSLSLRNWTRATNEGEGEPDPNASVDCGWGRLIFGQTFTDPKAVAQELLEESEGRRDIVMYIRDPHVVIAMAPQNVFLDPSHTYRLWLGQYRPSRHRPKGFICRLLNSRDDAKGIDALYRSRSMIPPGEAFVWESRMSRELVYIVAEDENTGQIIGAVNGVDHKHAFDDPENGCSLWALAVDPQTTHPGIGEALSRQLIEYFLARGRDYLDLSVVHDNQQAIRLYEKLGFKRVPVFALKRKNSYNEPLFIADPPEAELNPYAAIIIREARRRGIGVEVEDAVGGFFRLNFGGRSIACRESLSELTSAVAMSRCDNKATTRRVLQRAGICVPAQIEVKSEAQALEFLAEHERVVVKPARGEQGAGISVDVSDAQTLKTAIERAGEVCESVLLETYEAGADVRVIVINDAVVAAAIRRPAQVVGTGEHSIAELIATTSRRRAAATGGESRIPMDAETERCVRASGHAMSDILPAGETLAVRKTANLHTGGTIHDVTERLHPSLAEVSIKAARALKMPVVGLDLLVPDIEQDQYVIIEANERPGLANHEPQPTAERFIDLLFPQTASR